MALLYVKIATKKYTMAKIINKPHSFIGYQYFIERDGTIYKGRLDTEEGAHCRGHNKRTIGICLMGNGCEKDFSVGQYKSLRELVDRKMKEYNLDRRNLYPHSAFTPTLCPSDYLRNWILKY